MITINSAKNRTATLRELTGGVASDNKMEFGIKITSSSSATNTAMDNVKLVFQGTAADYIEGIENISYNVSSDARTLLGKPMNAAVAANLRSAVDALDNALAAYTSKILTGTAAPSDVNAWITAMEALPTPTEAARKSVEAYMPLVAQIAMSRSKADAYPQKYGNGVFASELGAINGNCSMGVYADSEIPAAVIEVKGITNRYLLADAMVLGSATNPIDVTDLVVTNAGFDGDSYAGWTASPAPGMGYNSAEFWNTNFNISQILYGMPAGTYRLQTRGFYRYGYQGDNLTAYNNGTLKRNAKIYITHATEGTRTAEVMAISDDPSEDTYWGGWSSELYDGKPVPNDMQAGAHAIDGCGKYAPKNGYNTVDITVSKIGDITIGAKKETLVNGDWSFFGDFSLYCLGDGEQILELDEAEDNLSNIDESIIYDKVILKRTIKANYWNTFVVPFDMAAPAGWVVKELVGATRNGDAISLDFSDIASDGTRSIKAGVPYMVRTDKKVEYIQAEYVQVSKEVIVPGTGCVDFVGVYKKGYVPNGSFFISNNVFYRAAKDNSNTIKAFRAYITPHKTASALSFRVGEDDDDDTNVESVAEELTVVAIYNANGVRIDDMQEGLNILLMSDGSRVKVLIK